MRSVWKGHIRFSLVTIPIQIFNAVETKGNISFRQLHVEDNGAIGYRKYCKSCDKTVSSSDIVKGFEYEPDTYAVFKGDELQSVKLKSTRAIDIEAFVDQNEVHPSRYENVYFVGPEGDIAKKTFSLLCKTLRDSGKAGIGRIILRDREDVVMITPHENALIMYKLRFPYEKLEEPDEAQLKLAKQLVETLSTTFDKIDFEDRYKDALMDLVEKKIEGKEVVNMDQEEKDKPVVDIMDALQKSIEESKKKTA